MTNSTNKNSSLSLLVAENLLKEARDDLTFAPPFFESFLQKCANENNIDACELYVTTIIRVLYGVFPDSSDHPNFKSFSEIIPKTAKELSEQSTVPPFDEERFLDLEEELHGKSVLPDLEYFEEFMLEFDKECNNTIKPPKNVCARLCVDFADLKDYAISKKQSMKKYCALRSLIKTAWIMRKLRPICSDSLSMSIYRISPIKSIQRAEKTFLSAFYQLVFVIGILNFNRNNLKCLLQALQGAFFCRLRLFVVLRIQFCPLRRKRQNRAILCPFTNDKLCYLVQRIAKRTKK